MQARPPRPDAPGTRSQTPFDTIFPPAPLSAHVTVSGNTGAGVYQTVTGGQNHAPHIRIVHGDNYEHTTRIPASAPRELGGREYGCCAEGTRVQLLNEIVEWSETSEVQEKVFLVTGAPGTGKSTIADTITRWASGHLHSLAAAPTVARLAFTLTFDNKAATLIDPLVMEPSFELFKATQHRFEKYEDLFHRLGEYAANTSLRNVSFGLASNVLVIIDALDEAPVGEEGPPSKVLRNLTALCARRISNLRILVTCRNDYAVLIRLLGHSAVVKKIGTPAEEARDIQEISATLYSELGRTLELLPSDQVKKAFPTHRVQCIATKVAKKAKGNWLFATLVACEWSKRISSRRFSASERIAQVDRLLENNLSAGVISIQKLYMDVLLNSISPESFLDTQGSDLSFADILGLLLVLHSNYTPYTLACVLAEANYTSCIEPVECASVLSTVLLSNWPVNQLIELKHTPLTQHSLFVEYIQSDGAGPFQLDFSRAHEHLAHITLRICQSSPSSSTLAAQRDLAADIVLSGNGGLLFWDCWRKFWPPWYTVKSSKREEVRDQQEAMAYAVNRCFAHAQAIRRHSENKLADFFRELDSFRRGPILDWLELFLVQHRSFPRAVAECFRVLSIADNVLHCNDLTSEQVENIIHFKSDMADICRNLARAEHHLSYAPHLLRVFVRLPPSWIGVSEFCSLPRPLQMEDDSYAFEDVSFSYPQVRRSRNEPRSAPQAQSGVPQV